jgi:hypothetical protein
MYPTTTNIEAGIFRGHTIFWCIPVSYVICKENSNRKGAKRPCRRARARPCFLGTSLRKGFYTKNEYAPTNLLLLTGLILVVCIYAGPPTQNFQKI